MGEGGSKERWRARVASAAAAFLLEYPGNGDVRGACRRKRKFALRRERERESFSASRENDSRRTNEKGSTMTAKRAHPPRRFDLSVLESLKRGTRVSFGRDVRITSVYIRIYTFQLPLAIGHFSAI